MGKPSGGVWKPFALLGVWESILPPARGVKVTYLHPKQVERLSLGLCLMRCPGWLPDCFLLVIPTGDHYTEWGKDRGLRKPRKMRVSPE